MKAINILYIRPRDITANGVGAYSQIILDAFSLYKKDEYKFTDAALYLDAAGAYDLASSSKLDNAFRTVFDTLLKADIDLIWAEIGICDYVEFHAVRYMRKHYPDVPALVTLHDPPQTVVNLLPSFYFYQSHLAVRCIRKLFNMTFGRRIETDFYKLGCTWLTLSKRGDAQLTMRLKSVSDEKFITRTIPHLNYYNRKYDYPRLLRSNTDLRLGFLGSITRSKGLDTLIKAAIIANSKVAHEGGRVTVKISGAVLFDQDLLYMHRLKQMVADNGLMDIISFSGRLSDEELPIFFSQLDLLVLPYNETASGSASGPLMWARSFGVPVIASATRNMPEMVSNRKDGLLFSPGNVHELAECISEVALCSELLEKLRVGAELRCADCSWEQSVNGLSAIIGDILKQRPQTMRQ